MPHVVLNSPLPLSEIGERFEPNSFSSGKVHVNMLESFMSVHEKKFLVEVYISEEPLRQRLGITVKSRSAGELVVGLSEMGFPRVTAGTQLAIAWLALWIVGLHPDAEVLTSNLQASRWDEAMMSKASSGSAHDQHQLTAN